VYFAHRPVPGLTDRLSAARRASSRPARAIRGQRRRVSQGGCAPTSCSGRPPGPSDEDGGAAWDAPFGRGRPGWHLECSANGARLVKQRFGVDVLDIQRRRGPDLPAHEARDSGAELRPHGREATCRYCCTGSSCRSGAGKSRAVRNVTTARDPGEDGVDPGAVRLAAVPAHYRQSLDFTDEGCGGAEGAAGWRVQGATGPRRRRRGWAGGRSTRGAPARGGDRALDDDLNGPRAWRRSSTSVREATGCWTPARVGRRFRPPGPGPTACWTCRASGRVSAEVTEGSAFGTNRRPGREEAWAVCGPLGG